MENKADQPAQTIDYWQVLRNHWGVILLTLLMAIVSSFVVTTLMEPKYRSVTKFQIKEDRTIVLGKNQLNTLPTRDFLATQTRSIVSNETLKLVDGGKDVRKYTKDLGDDYSTALTIFASKFQVDLEFGTSIVLVSAEHEKKEIARELADLVRKMYKRRREEARATYSSSALDQMKLEYAKMEALVKLRKDAVDKSSRAHGLIYARDRYDDVRNKAKVDFDQLTTELRERETALTRLKDQVSGLRILTDQDLAYHIESDVALISKPRVPILTKSLIELENQLEQAKIQNLMANHPKVKSIRAKMVSDTAELKKELTSARELIEKLLENKTKELASIDKEFKKSKKDYEKFVQTLNDHRIKIEDYEHVLQELQELERRKRDLMAAEGYLSPPIIVEQTANLPLRPSSPNIKLIMGVGSIAGLVCGIGIAFLLELMDTSVKRMEDVERYLQVPVLAVIPQDVGLLHQEGQTSADAEAYRILRTNIEFNRKNPDDNAITVVSGGAGEGKSTTVINLAYICAQGGYTTLLIDADLRRPRLHSYLDLPNKIGLTNYLTTDTPLENVIVKTPTENLFFMPSGTLPHDAAGVLNSRRMTELVTEVKSRFDLVFVDSPPILGVSDASVIANEVDHTMIVVQHRKLPRKLLIRVKQAVEAVGGNIIGVVLNNVDVRSDTEYQYYTSYYTYYTPTAQREAAELAAEQKNTTVEKDKPTNTKKISDEDLY